MHQKGHHRGPESKRVSVECVSERREKREVRKRVAGERKEERGEMKRRVRRERGGEKGEREENTYMSSSASSFPFYKCKKKKISSAQRKKKHKRNNKAKKEKMKDQAKERKAK